MRKITVGLLCALALATPISPAAGQSGALEEIIARCGQEHFREKDRTDCVEKQTAAARSFAPVSDFILRGEYAVQTLHLGNCLQRTRDRFGPDYVDLGACYDEAVKASCDGNQTCLDNSTISGIQTHIRNGTKP